MFLIQKGRETNKNNYPLKINVKNNFTKIPFETKKHDVVTIDGEYTIPGEIQLDKIEITTDFGSLSIPRDKINSIEIFIDSEGDV